MSSAPVRERPTPDFPVAPVDMAGGGGARESAINVINLFTVVNYARAVVNYSRQWCLSGAHRNLMFIQIKFVYAEAGLMNIRGQSYKTFYGRSLLSGAPRPLPYTQTLD